MDNRIFKEWLKNEKSKELIEYFENNFHRENSPHGNKSNFF